jgi:cell division protein FtsI/penicillin-binding protein 2
LAATVARGAPGPPVVLDEEAQQDREPLPRAIATGLRRAMRTAGGAGPVRVPGAQVAGFAARSGGVRGDPAPPTGWWVGFVEGEGPDIAVAVVVEGGDDARAVEIAQRVLREVVG